MGQKKTKTDKDLRAIELRYHGTRAREAAKKLGISVNTYNGWFRAAGRLCERYEDYVVEQEEYYASAVRNRLVEAATRAVEVLVAQLECNSPFVAQGAAKEILNRAIGKAKNENESRPVIVRLTKPFEDGYVPEGYKANGEPFTTINDAA